MSLDDKEVGASRMAKGTRDIEAPPDGGLYLGGLPRTLTLRSMAGTKDSLKGVIQDFVFNRKPMPVNDPVAFDNVAMGRSLDDEPVDNNNELHANLISSKSVTSSSSSYDRSQVITV